MNSILSSDDLMTISALAREGTLSGAGRLLQTSHATVLRHLNAMEERLGTRLFERGRSGFQPTPAGEEALRTADTVLLGLAELEHRLLGRDLAPSGTIRITTTDSLLVGLLMPIFRNFRERYPDIDLEIAVSNRPFDLNRREADMAVRPASSPPESLYGRRIARIEQAVYAGSSMAQAVDETNIHRNDWIGPDETMHYRDLDKWMEGQEVGDSCIFRVDSVLAMRCAVRCGMGLAVLPLYLAENDTNLERIGPPIASLTTDLWILTHPELRTSGRIKALIETLRSEVPEHLAPVQ